MNLHEAIDSGDIDQLRELLHKGADANATDRRGWTALFFAVHERNAAAVRSLLEAGADPNVSTAGGITPLDKALSDGHVELVQLLSSHGAKALSSRDRSLDNRYAAASLLAALAWLNAGAALVLAAILLGVDLPPGLKWGLAIGFFVGALAWSALMMLAVHASDDLRRLRESSDQRHLAARPAATHSDESGAA